jgi:WD40 repeat protein
LQIRQLQSGRVVSEIRVPTADVVAEVTLSPFGEYVAAFANRKLMVWRTDSPTKDIWHCDSCARYWEFGADGTHFLFKQSSNPVSALDLLTLKEVGSFEERSYSDIRAFAWPAEGGLLLRRDTAGLSGNGIMRLVTMSSGSEPIRAPFYGHPGMDDAMVLSTAGRFLAGPTSETGVGIWDVERRALCALLEHGARVQEVLFDRREEHVFSVGSGRIVEWELHPRWPVDLDPTGGYTSGIWFGADGASVVVSADGYWLYDLRTGHRRRLPLEPLAPDRRARVEAYLAGQWARPVRMGTALASIESQLVDVADGARQISKPPARNEAISADGQVVATWTVDAINITNRATGTTNRIEAERPEHVQLSARGNFLAWRETVGQHDFPILLQATDGSIRHSLRTDSAVFAMALHPEGAVLAAGTASGHVIIWDSGSGTELLKLRTADSVNSVAFSRDGSLIAYGCDRQVTVTPWKAADLVENICSRLHLESGDAPMEGCPGVRANPVPGQP